MYTKHEKNMATKEEPMIMADESVIAYFNFTKPPTAEGLSGIIKKSALLLSYVSECLGVSTAHGGVAHTNSENKYVSNSLGQVKLDRESVVSVLETQSSVLHTLSMYVPSRNPRNILTENVAILEVKADNDTKDMPTRDNLGHPFSRVRTDGTVVLALRTDCVCKSTLEARKLLISNMCALAAKLGCYYGYIQCERHTDTLAGDLYARSFGGPFAMQPIVRELAWWHSLTNRQNLARGVYWGNFFGPSFTQLLDKHGILQQLADYQVRNRPEDVLVPGDQQVQRFANGSSFFSLTDDVLHSSSWLDDHPEIASERDESMVACNRNDPYLMLASWLHCKLRSIGAML